MEQLFKFDPFTAGTKGLVFIGTKILLYRRDNKTSKHPLEIDVPGGGPKRDETPFETFKREVKEEFGLNITPEHIIYARKYYNSFDGGGLVTLLWQNYQKRKRRTSISATKA